MENGESAKRKENFFQKIFYLEKELMYCHENTVYSE